MRIKTNHYSNRLHMSRNLDTTCRCDLSRFHRQHKTENQNLQATQEDTNQKEVLLETQGHPI